MFSDFTQYLEEMKIEKKMALAIVIYAIVAYLIYPSQYEINITKAFAIKNSNKDLIVFDGVTEPEIPDLGDNNKTIYGIDKNNNSIRDDIEIWINRVALNYNERMMMRQYASDLEYRIKASETNDNKIISHAESSEYTTGFCLIFILGKSKSDELRRTMEMMVYNTFSRRKAINNISRHNCVYESTIKSMTVNQDYLACRFEIENKNNLMKKYLENGNNNDF